MVSKKELYAQLLNHREREMRTRISLLDWATENEIRNIEGRVTDGNITVDGNSPVRRTCSLTMIVDKNITVGQEKISDLITYAKELNITSLSITDNNMYGVMDFYKACINNMYQFYIYYTF